MKIAKNIIVLTIITVVSGFLLGFVYDITKDPIAKAEEEAKQAAYRAVFNEAASFETIEDYDIRDELDSHGFTDEKIDEALVAKDSSGNPIGYVFKVTSSQGYGGDVTFSMGVGNDGLVKGIEFLSISETPGLGMNATKDEFKSQFKGLPAGLISYTKTGKSANYEIDAISGATITTNAVTRATNAGLIFYNILSGGTGNE